MTFTAASGAEFTCGDGTGRPVSARFLSERTQRRILLNPELALGEAYMDGTFVVENGSIADALEILLDQPEMVPRWARLQWWLRYFGRHIRQFNRRGRARTNVAHHYDLDGRLYSLFLDADKQYSCAYFETAGRVARRCPTRQEASPCRQAPDRARNPRARHRFGLGWPWPLSGRNDGADVTGVTLSSEQLQVSNARAAERNLAGSAKFLLQRLSRYSRPLRPDRLGRHVRTCRRRLLRNLFQAMRRSSQRRRRHGVARDRPLHGARRDEPLDHEVHLPGRLHPRPLRGHARDREGRPSGLRHRDPAPALCARR